MESVTRGTENGMMVARVKSKEKYIFSSQMLTEKINRFSFGVLIDRRNKNRVTVVLIRTLYAAGS
jgi:hypothetical protein